MKSIRVLWTAFTVMVLMLLFVDPLRAADSGIGTWVRKTDPAISKGNPAMEFTMIIEAWGNGGRKITIRMKHPGDSDRVMIVESPMDGTDAPVLVDGKPSGETMGIKRLDSRHTVNVIKLNGDPIGISRAALSADFNMLTVENEISSATGGQQPGKNTEVWFRK